VSPVLRGRGSLIVGVPDLASMHGRILLACGHQPTQIRSASAHVHGFTRRGVFMRLVKQRVYEGQFLSFPVVNRLETNYYTGA
jgi:hypothetical protein